MLPTAACWRPRHPGLVAALLGSACPTASVWLFFLPGPQPWDWDHASLDVAAGSCSRVVRSCTALGDAVQPTMVTVLGRNGFSTAGDTLQRSHLGGEDHRIRAQGQKAEVEEKAADPTQPGLCHPPSPTEGAPYQVSGSPGWGKGSATGKHGCWLCITDDGLRLREL